VKKGKIQEIFSKAQYADDPYSYKIFYRDFQNIKELTLVDFIEESNNFETIPITRIQMIKKGNETLFKKIRLR
jgi:uncharacterized protein (UPF0248 family)